MNYRQIKKYVKQVLPSWEWLDILGYKENKKEILKEFKTIKNKRHLERYLDN